MKGLSEAEIDGIERAFSLRFPPDFRLFLRVLHATDRPMFCEDVVESEGDGTPRAKRDAMLAGIGADATSISYSPGFNNWLDLNETQGAIDGVKAMIIEDVHRGTWLPEWGPQPESPEEASLHVRRLLDEAPKIAPVYGHRCLLLEPWQSGNPVLSIWGTDIITYGDDLQWYLLNDLGDLFRVRSEDEWEAAYDAFYEAKKAKEAHLQARPPPLTIPFWGELLAWNEALNAASRSGSSDEDPTVEAAPPASKPSP